MPYVIINRDRIEVAGTVSSATIAAQIQHVYFKDEKTIVVTPQEGKSFSQLTAEELDQLLRKLGVPGAAMDDADYPTQMAWLKYWCENAPITDPNQEALDYIQGILRNERDLTPPAEPVEKPKREPKPSTGDGAPSPKGSTGKVWEIADSHYHNVAEDGGSVDVKALRTAVIQACIQAGINEATAGTQWSKWKKSKGL